MTAFRLEFVPLDPAAPELGRGAVVPWDSDYFGFKVATYEPADSREPPADSDRWAQRLQDWMRAHDIALASCSVPADSFAWMALLAENRFNSVDLSLLAFARRLTTLPAPRMAVRPAEVDDLPALKEIAGTSFRFGRYHADARFPRNLADLRYRRWLHNAWHARSDTEHLLVCGSVGHPVGFVHAVLHGDLADLRLAAVDPAQNTGIAGAGLFVGALHQLVARGAKRAQARLSAGNIAILNLYSSLGFTFLEPEAIYHRHADSGRSLNSPS